LESTSTDLKNENKFALTFGTPLSHRRYFIDPKNVMNLYYKQILVFNVYYYTSNKLALFDEDQKLIAGSESTKKCYDHKFRFETYENKLDWVLTDIDDVLNGNPYASEPGIHPNLLKKKKAAVEKEKEDKDKD